MLSLLLRGDPFEEGSRAIGSGLVKHGQLHGPHGQLKPYWQERNIETNKQTNKSTNNNDELEQEDCQKKSKIVKDGGAHKAQMHTDGSTLTRVEVSPGSFT